MQTYCRMRVRARRLLPHAPACPILHRLPRRHPRPSSAGRPLRQALAAPPRPAPALASAPCRGPCSPCPSRLLFRSCCGGSLELGPPARPGLGAGLSGRRPEPPWVGPPRVHAGGRPSGGGLCGPVLAGCACRRGRCGLVLAGGASERGLCEPVLAGNTYRGTFLFAVLAGNT